MKKKRISKMTYMKNYVTCITLVGIVDLQWCIFKGLETLGGLIITEILGVTLIYAVKSFFGKREEERVRLQEEQAKYERDFERINE